MKMGKIKFKIVNVLNDSDLKKIIICRVMKILDFSIIL